MARDQAEALLRRNLTPAGIMAATATADAAARRYHCIFGRDAAICALAMTLSDDATLRAGAVNSLRTLAQHQADNGQVPKYVDVESARGDFWYVGCIDATLWWLIAIDFVDQHGHPGLRDELAESVARALVWLQCQEHPRLHLVQQNEASDWADIMPRSGFVMYSNALWYHVKRRYELADADSTRHHFNHLFHPFSRDLPEYRRLKLLTEYVLAKTRDHDLYLSFVNFSFFGEEGDVLGNLLAILFGLADPDRASQLLRALEHEAVATPWPVRAVCRPITQSDPLWRQYMARHDQNLEFQYHNGGSWPFIGGFWVLALAARGRANEAQHALGQLVQANARQGWQFNEWMHGQTGQPLGMAGQSWNAAMLLLAERGLNQSLF